MKTNIKISLLIISALIFSLSLSRTSFSYPDIAIVYKVWAVIKAFTESDVSDNECFAKKLMQNDKYQYDRFRYARRDLIDRSRTNLRTLQDPVRFSETLDAITQLLIVYRDFFEKFLYSTKGPCFDKIRIFLESPVLKEVEDYISEMPDEPRIAPFSIPDINFVYIPSPAESTLPITEILKQQGIQYDKLGINMQKAVDTADEWMWSHRDEVRNGLIIAGIAAIAVYNLPAIINSLARSVSPGLATSIFIVIPSGDNLFCTLKEDPKNGRNKIRKMSDYDCELKAQE